MFVSAEKQGKLRALKDLGKNQGRAGGEDCARSGAILRMEVTPSCLTSEAISLSRAGSEVGFLRVRV